MIFKNKSLIGIQLLFFVFLSLISCTTKTPNNSKKELYPSGKIKSEIPLNEGKENGLGIYYYESGSIKAWINKKDDLKDGYAYYFYPNGKLKSIEYNKNGKSDGDLIWFNENGTLENFSKFKNDKLRSYMEYDSNGNIIKASPFITIKREKDTIRLGETYSMNIIVNFPKRDFDCTIFIKIDSTKADGNIYQKIGSGENVDYSILPKEVGEHSYEINMLQLKGSSKN